MDHWECIYVRRPKWKKSIPGTAFILPSLVHPCPSFWGRSYIQRWIAVTFVRVVCLSEWQFPHEQGLSGQRRDSSTHILMAFSWFPHWCLLFLIVHLDCNLMIATQKCPGIMLRKYTLTTFFPNYLVMFILKSAVRIQALLVEWRLPCWCIYRLFLQTLNSN